MTAPYLPPSFYEARPAPEPARLPVPQRKKRSDLPVVLAGLPGVASAIYDAETTFAGMKRGATEQNPIMRPFVKAGRVPTYTLMAGQALGTAAIGKYLRDKGKPYWWVPQGLSAIGHLAAGLHNQGVNR